MNLDRTYPFKVGIIFIEFVLKLVSNIPIVLNVMSLLINMQNIYSG